MKDPLKLLVLTELFLPTKGGTAVWFSEVYRRLGGHEIHIITADVEGAEEFDTNYPNTIHRLNLRRVPWLKPESLTMYWKFLLTTLSLALRYRFTAIHAGRVLPEGLIAWLVARIVRVPVLIYAHGEEITTWRQPAKFKFMCFAYKHADMVIANSEFTREQLLTLGVKSERIRIITPGVDTNRFRPGLPCDDLRKSVGLLNGQKLILSVGRLSRRKGFDRVIQSLPELLKSGRDVQYVLIGTGEDGDYLQNLAGNSGVLDRVHLLGPVCDKDLPRWYGACDVFAMPNREIDGDTEGFGLVFLEAAACGKPSIAGRAGGTGAAVLNGETGLRVDGNQIGEIVTAFKRLLSDVGPEIGAVGRKRALSMFTWEYVADRTRRAIIGD